jgi:hypothetical protein
MNIKSLIKSAIETFQTFSGILRGANEVGVPDSAYLVATAPEEVRIELTQGKSRQAKKYDPRNHTNFYVISSALIQTLLEDPSGKTARIFADRTGFAESTIRAVCKVLADDKIFVRTQEFPATYGLVDESIARDQLLGFGLITEMRG